MRKYVPGLILFILLAFCFFAACTSIEKNKQTEIIQWIPFNWIEVEISGRIFEKAAILIPVTIDGIQQKFNMQFDLGANFSSFYEKPLKYFFEKYPFLNNIDTSISFQMNGHEFPALRNVNLRLGEVIFNNIDAGLLIDHGIEISPDSINSETEILIGTIGADLVKNKILIIDYKSNRLAIADTLPPEYHNASFQIMIVDNGRIKIPFLINGKEENLMFDTGSSIFSLITTKENALEIGGNETVDFLMVWSWFNYIPFYGLKTVSSVIFGDKKLENIIVYYNYDWDDFFKSENIWGLTGNALFFDNVVIIDYKNNRFGVY